jgi:hypothetical protein
MPCLHTILWIDIPSENLLRNISCRIRLTPTRCKLIMADVPCHWLPFLALNEIESVIISVLMTLVRLQPIFECARASIPT